MIVVQQVIDFLASLVVWWFMVEPWEQAIRVRFGKHVRLYTAGWYWKIPFFDVIYRQNVRRRVSSIPVQTLTTHDGKSLTVYGSIGYKIVDVLKLHLSLHDAEQSVQQEVLGQVTRYVVGNGHSDCTPKKIVEHVQANLKLDQYGLGDVEFFLIGYVSDIPTYRILQDSIAPYTYGNSLSTVLAASSPGAPR